MCVWKWKFLRETKPCSQAETPPSNSEVPAANIWRVRAYDQWWMVYGQIPRMQSQYLALDFACLGQSNLQPKFICLKTGIRSKSFTSPNKKINSIGPPKVVEPLPVVHHPNGACPLKKIGFFPEKIVPKTWSGKYLEFFHPSFIQTSEFFGDLLRFW